MFASFLRCRVPSPYTTRAGPQDHATEWRAERAGASGPGEHGANPHEELLGANGNFTRNVVPFPSALVNESAPPWLSTIAFVIERPSPTPGMAASVAVDARKKRSNKRAWSASGMPTPVSQTSIRACPSLDD